MITWVLIQLDLRNEAVGLHIWQINVNSHNQSATD